MSHHQSTESKSVCVVFFIFYKYHNVDYCTIMVLVGIDTVKWIRQNILSYET